MHRGFVYDNGPIGHRAEALARPLNGQTSVLSRIAAVPRNHRPRRNADGRASAPDKNRHQGTTVGVPRGIAFMEGRQTDHRPMQADGCKCQWAARKQRSPWVRGFPKGRRIAVLWSPGVTGAADAAPVKAMPHASAA